MERTDVFIGSDHAGFHLKEAIIRALENKEYHVTDIGPDSYNENDDYPDYIIPTAEAVVEYNALGVILGGSGQGEAIAANKVKGARAAVYYGNEEKIIELSRKHNNANIISLGARFLRKEEAIKAVQNWINTTFTHEERHERRISKIKRYENGANNTISNS